MSGLVQTLLSPFSLLSGAKRLVSSPTVSSELSEDEEEHPEDEIMARTATRGKRTVISKLVANKKKDDVRDQSDSDSDSTPEEEAPSVQTDSEAGDRSYVMNANSRRGWKKVRRVTKAEKGKPPIRNAYDTAEDYKIIRYIIREKAGDTLGGNVFWKECEKKRITGQQRTFQSLKERFRRHIAPDIALYPDLTADEREAILSEISGLKVPKRHPAAARPQKSRPKSVSPLKKRQSSPESPAGKNRPSTSRLSRGAIGKSPRKSPVGGKRGPVFREEDESDGSDDEETENRSSPRKSPVKGKRRPVPRIDDESDEADESNNKPTPRKSPRKATNAYLDNLREKERKASGSKSKKSNSKK